MRKIIPIYLWASIAVLMAFGLGIKMTGPDRTPFVTDIHAFGDRLTDVVHPQPKPLPGFFSRWFD